MALRFLPWAPLGQNRKALEVLEKVAAQLGATTLQTALAWLLKRSKVMLADTGNFFAGARGGEHSRGWPGASRGGVPGAVGRDPRAGELSRMKTYRIALVPGDGIGKEVVPAGRQVLEALTGCGFRCEFECFNWGGDYYRQHGEMMPESGLAALRGKDAILFGSAGDPHIPDHITLWGLRLKICQGLDQYANVRPTRILPGIESPLKRCRVEDLNWVIVRENTEGEYSGVGGRVHPGHPLEVATDLSLMTRGRVERIHRFAFRLAQSRPRKLLTVVTKSNAQRHAMVMWDEIAAQVAAEFPDVTLG